MAATSRSIRYSTRISVVSRMLYNGKLKLTLNRTIQRFCPLRYFPVWLQPQEFIITYKFSTLNYWEINFNVHTKRKQSSRKIFCSGKSKMSSNESILLSILSTSRQDCHTFGRAISVILSTSSSLCWKLSWSYSSLRAVSNSWILLKWKFIT